MRLTQEHVGKLVRFNHFAPNEKGKLLALHGEYVWIAIADGGGYQSWVNHDNWEIEEPEKKPSERIRELVAIENKLGFIGDLAAIHSIIQYLDEQHDRKGK